MRSILTGLALALCALPASAATLKLKDGTSVECKVLAYDTATKTLQVRLADGREAQYTMDQLNGRSVYQVNSSLIPKDDARAQLLAANFARDAELYAHAVRRYENAVKLDPSLKPTVEAEMVKLRRGAAELCVRNARAAVAKKDLKEAERYLEILIEKLPEEPEAGEARAILERHYADARAQKIAAADAKASAALQKDVDKGKKRYAQMVEKTKKGLQTSSTSQAEGLFRAALADGEAVLDDIDAIETKYDDPAVREQAAGYRQVVTEQMVEVHLHVASQLATKSDYRGAQKAVNAALALDPRNEAALSMRARIEDYASRGVGWGRPWI